MAPSVTADHMPENPISIVYSGHMGLLHDFQLLLDFFSLAEPSDSLHQADIIFRFHSDGPHYRRLREELKNRGFGDSNRIVLKFNNLGSVALCFGKTLPDEEWNKMMANCQVGVVPMIAGAENVVMPSKTYGSLLAGQALLAIVPSNSDVADIVVANNCGWVVSVDSQQSNECREHCYSGPEGLLAALLEIKNLPEIVALKRSNALGSGCQRFSMESIAFEWQRLLRDAGIAVKPDGN